MINVTPRYMEECESSKRDSYITAKFGYYNNEAKKIIKKIYNQTHGFVNLKELYDDVKDNVYNYISNEPNRVLLDGSFVFIQNKYKPSSLQNIGYWSSEQSNDNCKFNDSTNKLYIDLDHAIPFINLTLYFKEIIKSFSVYYYLDDNLIKQIDITNNDNLIVQTNSEQIDLYFNKLRIDFKYSKEPNRYAKLNEIDFGYYAMFSNKDISSIDVIEEVSIDSSEIVSNTMQLSIQDNNKKYDILNPYNNLKFLKEKSQISIYHNLKVGNKYTEVPLGKYLIKSFNYEANKLNIECYDNLYFMNKTYYGGKFYKEEIFNNVVKDIFSYFGYSSDNYMVDPNDIELQNKKINGYIPVVEFKEALRLLCESVCAIIKVNRDGIIFIFRKSNDGGKLFKQKSIKNSQPQYNIFNSIVEINEYVYSETSEDVQIYKGTLEKGIHTIVFSKFPINTNLYKDNYNSIIDSSTSGYNVLDLGACSAIVEVTTSSAEIILKAKLIEEKSNTYKYYKNKNDNVDELSVSSIYNNLITKENISQVANWKLDRGEMIYSFSTNSTPYIEVGDTCKYEIPYRDKSGGIIKRNFMITRLEFTNGILQNIEGE